MNGDKYAGIVTVLAVIISVEYSTEISDIWDIALGLVAVVLAKQYKKDIDGNDKLFVGLISILMATGLIIAIYAFLESLNIRALDKAILYKWWILDVKFIAAAVLSFFFSIRWQNKHNKAN